MNTAPATNDTSRYTVDHHPDEQYWHIRPANAPEDTPVLTGAVSVAGYRSGACTYNATLILHAGIGTGTGDGQPIRFRDHPGVSWKVQLVANRTLNENGTSNPTEAPESTVIVEAFLGNSAPETTPTFDDVDPGTRERLTHELRTMLNTAVPIIEAHLLNAVFPKGGTSEVARLRERRNELNELLDTADQLNEMFDAADANNTGRNNPDPGEGPGEHAWQTASASLRAERDQINERLTVVVDQLT